MRYSFARTLASFATTDANANAGGEGFGLPFGSGGGAITQGAFLTLIIYKYHLRLALNFAAAGAQEQTPSLCWVNNAGAAIDYIQNDHDTYQSIVGWQTFDYEHDYGDTGRVCYRPPLVAVVSLGVVDRRAFIAPGAVGGYMEIEYGIGIDYRGLTAPVQVQP